MNNKVYIIAGPTAVGKSAVAINLAKQLNGEIINCDSVQLYKYMDIGSAKPTAEEMKEVPHHLFSVVTPEYDMTAATYQKLAFTVIDNVLARGKTPIVVGGTGLYINSIVYDMDFGGPQDKVSEASIARRKELEDMAEKMGPEYMHAYLEAIDPKSAERIHPNNIRKVVRAIEAFESGEGIKPMDAIPLNTKYDFELIVLNTDREVLYNKINRRVITLVKSGLFDEVKKLLKMGYSMENSSMKAIGYKEIIAYFNGECDQKTAVENIMKNTRHFAKRQLTWFKRYDFAKWIEIENNDTIGTVTDKVLKVIQ